ncbi:hypothetical protein [Marinobacter sp. 2_MG-2023]|nr:hypothetical protein [Marinobacter sp. 2_MG-2023]MDO6444133.1 hypothetical protein [Marinobacter sp. 2_MG-2023]
MIKHIDQKPGQGMTHSAPETQDLRAQASARNAFAREYLENIEVPV